MSAMVRLVHRQIWLGLARCYRTGRCPLVLVCSCGLPTAVYFFFLGELVFFSLLYRVFLPFAILGSSLRTCSTSSSVHIYLWTPSIIFGAGIFPALMYFVIAAGVNPSCFAAWVLE